MKLKEKLMDLLGGAGFVVYYLLSLFIAFYPLIFIDLNFWLRVLLVAIVQFIPILNAPLWIWGLVEAAQGKQDAFAIIYYILFAIIALWEIISILSAFAKKE